MIEAAIQSSDAGDSVHDSLLLHKERIEIARRTVPTGSIEVARKTVEHEQTVSTELATDQVEVTRVPIGRTIDAMPAVREQGDVTIIPVVEEIVVVEKRLVLKEEIHLRRIRTTRTHSETVTLRAQQAVVTRTTLHGAGEADVVDITSNIQQQDQ